MHLQKIGWVRERSGGESEQYILYTASGLSEGKNCVIGDAGLGFDGKRKWFAHLYDSGEVIENLGPYNSADDALRAVEKHPNRESS